MLMKSFVTIIVSLQGVKSSRRGRDRMVVGFITTDACHL
jgi:hypothetical protein